ncbi:MAG: 6-phosphofructokinase [Chloroflexota bacterium]|nr:6-phosphofructokinase [Chloroflexota bacterium]
MNQGASEHTGKSIAVITSGGDSQGMNAAVRAVVRTGLNRGIDVFAIYEGYQGMVEGGDYFRRMTWESVGGILHQSGTVIGTARCEQFRGREGRRSAVKNLISHSIDRLIVIGGDGSLTGANLLCQEWPELLSELVELGEIESALADAHPRLILAGMVGSIDNDMFGTDMTIGADSALHRIAEAVDAISSTAASHRRAFVIEVMGRHCGYLALMSAIATGANWVFIPEYPPEQANWEDVMCDNMEASREMGRRHSIVIVAEGARDRQGRPITSEYVKEVLEDRLAKDTRITVLGHIQRGGKTNAFDRVMGTILGYHAVDEVLTADPDREPVLIGIQQHQVIRSPLMECVAQTHQVAKLIAAGDYEKAVFMRGGSFAEEIRTFYTLASAQPSDPAPGQKALRLAVMHAGGPAPGMNTAVRVAVRLGIDKGHKVFGIRNGFEGLIEGDIQEMDWMTVSGWVSRGGAELGTNRRRPRADDFEAIARHLEQYRIDGLLMIGGWTGYQACCDMQVLRDSYPAFDIPMICFPASIDNNLPASQLSIGADTALNSIAFDVDKIKQSAVASRRCFVVEVMGRYCGYLALMSGISTGAEKVYLPEEGVTLADLQHDVNLLIEGFEHGKRLGLMIRNEKVDPLYTTDFMCALFEKEGGDLFDVRQAILGHVQQGGNPSPFDRIQATRLASSCVEFLIEQASRNDPRATAIGLQRGRAVLIDLADLPPLMDHLHERPKREWWLSLRPIAKTMAYPNFDY